jgi:predicted phage-related endonuclease
MVIKAARGQPICEIKTTGRADEWADGQIPARVLLQVCAQMACAGSSQAHIAALVARFGLSMEMREVNAEAEVLDLIRTIEDKAAEWWERHITGDTEPDGAASADYISKRVRQAGKVVQLSADLIAGFLAAKAATKEAEMREDEAKTALLTALGDAEAGEAEGGYTVKFTKILTERFDSKGLRSAHPDIAAKFVTESSYRRLTVKGGKA